MADPNNAIIYQHRIGCMFICKAGNTSIKRALADALDLPDADMVRDVMKPHKRLDLHLPTPNKDDVWRLRADGFLTFAVIRHPLARLVSCYADKIEAGFHAPFARKYRGQVWQGMQFAEWIAFVHRIPDGKSDQHFRSMAWELMTNEGRIIPEHVIKIENDGWWERLRGLIYDHCGLDIGPERHENAVRHRGWQSYYTPETRALAAERYADDLRVFGYA